MLKRRMAWLRYINAMTNTKDYFHNVRYKDNRDIYFCKNCGEEVVYDKMKDMYYMMMLDPKTKERHVCRLKEQL